MFSLIIDAVKSLIEVAVEARNASKEQEAELRARVEVLFRETANAIAALGTSVTDEHSKTEAAFEAARQRLSQIP